MDKEIYPARNKLYGFTENMVKIMGGFKLPITLGEGWRSATHMGEFMVVDEDISNSAIFGRTTMVDMRISTCVYYLTMKFSTLNAVRCLRGCHLESKECYSREVVSVEKIRMLPNDKKVEIQEDGPTKKSKDPCNVVVILIYHENHPLNMMQFFRG